MIILMIFVIIAIIAVVFAYILIGILMTLISLSFGGVLQEKYSKQPEQKRKWIKFIFMFFWPISAVGWILIHFINEFIDGAFKEMKEMLDDFKNL